MFIAGPLCGIGIGADGACCGFFAAGFFELGAGFGGAGMVMPGMFIGWAPASAGMLASNAPRRPDVNFTK
jgi:hypothetical protein